MFQVKPPISLVDYDAVMKHYFEAVQEHNRMSTALQEAQYHFDLSKKKLAKAEEMRQESIRMKQRHNQWLERIKLQEEQARREADAWDEEIRVIDEALAQKRRKDMFFERQREKRKRLREQAEQQKLDFNKTEF